MKIKGEVTVKLFDQFGNQKDEQRGSNIITTVGKNEFTRMLNTDFGYDEKKWFFEYGSSTTTPALGDTALGSPIAKSRHQCITFVFDNNIEFYRVNDSSFSGTINEAGIFSTLEAGTGILFAHKKFTSPMVKAVQDVISLDWVLTLG